jgi:hypothetical protein
VFAPAHVVPKQWATLVHGFSLVRSWHSHVCCSLLIARRPAVANSRVSRSYRIACNMRARNQEEYTIKKKYAFVLFGLLPRSSLRLFAVSISTPYMTYPGLKLQGGSFLWVERIQQVVDRQLAAKGWTRHLTNVL